MHLRASKGKPVLVSVRPFRVESAGVPVDNQYLQLLRHNESLECDKVAQNNIHVRRPEKGWKDVKTPSLQKH